MLLRDREEVESTFFMRCIPFRATFSGKLLAELTENSMSLTGRRFSEWRYKNKRMRTGKEERLRLTKEGSSDAMKDENEQKPPFLMHC
jgi:hypothetical protein